MKSCPEGIILTFRGRYLHGTCPLPGCTFPESFGSRTLPVWAAARSTTFSKGSRGGTWHVPRGTWCHVTNAIVVPALWCIFWCLLRPDRPSRSGAIKESPWTDRQTDRLTYKQHWKNQNFDPPNFWTPLNFSISKDLITLHPCTKFGLSSSKGVGARGHKAEK